MDQDQTTTARVVIGDATFAVRVADSNTERTQGLSGTEPLGEREGMWFSFPESGLHSFWMKDMRYALDIIWLDEELRVVHIEKGISPETYPASFSPSSPARYVLELSAGSAERYGIRIGDSATVKD